MKIRISNRRPTQIAPGVYRVLHDCYAVHCHGKGDSRRDVETKSLKAGQTFVLKASGANGFWWGVQLSGGGPADVIERDALEEFADAGELSGAIGGECDDNSRIREVQESLVGAVEL